ncbi:MAG: nucleoside triphosphate pyrophosphatase [Pseudomonadota bacterium]
MICPKAASISATSKPRLILGSASPRRRDLLEIIGVTPDEIQPADINEDPIPGEKPLAYVARIAAEKTQAISTGTNDIILGADTTVACGQRILGKPANADEARGFLMLLSGRRHKVMTSLSLRRADHHWTKTVTTSVKMKRLSDVEIAGYLAAGEWQGKAGGYSIQGIAGAFIPWISGSYSAVVGLPLAETANLLRAAGYPIRFDQGTI